MTEYKNPLDIITEGRELPTGYDAWAIKSAAPDLTTKHGRRWPFPGRVAKTTWTTWCGAAGVREANVARSPGSTSTTYARFANSRPLGCRHER